MGFKYLSLLFIFVSVPPVVLADCKLNGSAREGTVNLSFGNVTVLPEAVAGSVIATTGGSTTAIANAVGMPANVSFMSCGINDISVWNGSSYGTVEYNGEILIDTGVQGLAIRTSTGATSGSNGTAVGVGVKFPPDYSAALSHTAITANQYGQRKFELVKIGDVVGGEIPGGTLVINRTGGRNALTWQLNASSVINAGCTASDYPGEVSLGSAYSSQFRSPGETQNETNFSISLTCNSTKLRPVIAFEGATDDAYPTIFSNRPGDGYAKNVGIQLQANGNVITPGSVVSLGQAGSPVNQYVFGASLRRTGDAVTAGSIDVTVTFTISYE